MPERSLPVRVLGRLRRMLWLDEEFRVYRMEARHARALVPGSTPIARDDTRVVAFYSPDNAWDCPREEFRRLSTQRLAQGHYLYAYVESGRLLHYSWTNPACSEVKTDFGNWIPLPPRSALLYDDNTHSAARGRGLHSASLRLRAWDVVAQVGVSWVYIAVRADNRQSRRNIERVGFLHAGSVWRRRRLGVATLAVDKELERVAARPNVQCTSNAGLRAG